MGNRKTKDFFTDPRGEKITLYEQTWDTHITQNHPEMCNRYSDLKTTIEDPDHIRAGRNPTTENLYVKQCISDHAFVSTRLIDDKQIIVTSFYAGQDRGSRGSIIWSKPAK